MSGKRVKMVIEAYKSPDFSGKVGEYTLQINPENYDRKAQPAVDSNTMRLTTGENVPANKPADVETIAMTFVIDATGVVPGCTSIKDNIASLRSLCLEVNGEIHRANYLKIRWGLDFVFPCVMKDLKADYTLFSPDGTPVRAVVKTLFQEFVDPVTNAKLKNESSPDLTHVKTVRDGDTLPGLCFDVYGDPKYYIQVAEFNGLLNFNRLKPNQQLIFPPLAHD